MVKVTYIPCLFEDKRYEFESRNLNITSVFHSLLKKYPEIRQDSPNITVRVNGKKIQTIQWPGYCLQDGDRVLVVQDVGFEAIVSILGIGGAFVGIGTGGGAMIGLTLSTIAFALDLALTVAYCIYSYSSAAKSKPNYGGEGLANSPTYGWDGIQMQIRAGIPVPIVYGEHSIGGNVCHTILASF